MLSTNMNGGWWGVNQQTSIPKLGLPINVSTLSEPRGQLHRSEPGPLLGPDHGIGYPLAAAITAL